VARNLRRKDARDKITVAINWWLLFT
jgi:hypothetical protein